jgi:RND family efflux transporter MFP subunit
MKNRNVQTATLAVCVIALAVSACAPEGDSAATVREAPDATEIPAAAEAREVIRNVRVLTAATTTLSEYVDISGPVRPVTATDISVEEPGVVKRLPLEKGQNGKKGAAIVELERSVLEAEMRAARADFVVAEYNEDRTRNLYEANSVSGQEMLLAKSQLEKTRAAQDLATLRYERAIVRAPYAGLLSERHVELGQYVVPGQVVARFVDPFTLKLVANVTERDVALIAPDAPVDVDLDGLRDPIPATVHWVAFEANPTSGKFEVEIHIDNADLGVRPGVVGRARVLRDTHDDVVAIPRDAIVDRRGARSVFVVEKGRARVRDVVLGGDQGLMVIVRDGIDAGDEIIVRGQRDVRDGDRVNVTERASAADGGMEGDPATSGTEASGQ